MAEHLTLSQLHKSGKIWWIKSVQTLRKWVESDIRHENLLKTVVVGENNKRRYYFTPDNVEKYVKAFTDNKIVSIKKNA